MVDGIAHRDGSSSQSLQQVACADGVDRTRQSDDDHDGHDSGGRRRIPPARAAAAAGACCPWASSSRRSICVQWNRTKLLPPSPSAPSATEKDGLTEHAAAAAAVVHLQIRQLQSQRTTHDKERKRFLCCVRVRTGGTGLGREGGRRASGSQVRISRVLADNLDLTQCSSVRPSMANVLAVEVGRRRPPNRVGRRPRV